MKRNIIIYCIIIVIILAIAIWAIVDYSTSTKLKDLDLNMTTEEQFNSNIALCNKMSSEKNTCLETVVFTYLDYLHNKAICPESTVCEPLGAAGLTDAKSKCMEEMCVAYDDVDCIKGDVKLSETNVITVCINGQYVSTCDDNDTYIDSDGYELRCDNGHWSDAHPLQKENPA
ncbi:MAG: hypothetical protein PHH82_00535 [Candidatus ainarchaeum sp.]|nr:hypothetical protein [Candidatus ainarchaeum sp.]